MNFVSSFVGHAPWNLVTLNQLVHHAYIVFWIGVFLQINHT
jgi:hypothetical protein